MHTPSHAEATSGQLEKGNEKKYGEGKRAYDEGEFGSAAKTFSEIMNHVPESPTNRTIRASLVLDIMAAYQAAYEGSGDIAMLKAGMDAYYGYFRAYRDRMRRRTSRSRSSRRGS